jgi:hypothetical protein
VNPKQADLLAYADANTTLRLALRSPTEPIRSLPTEDLVLTGNQNAAPAAAPAPAPQFGPFMPMPEVRPPSPPRLALSPVEVIVGDQIEGSSSDSTATLH